MLNSKKEDICLSDFNYHSLRAPAEVLGVNAEYPSPGHGGRSGSFQMGDFKEQTHGGRQADPLITGESQNLDGREVFRDTWFWVTYVLLINALL